MQNFLISAAHKSSGKTTVSIGLCAALRERGYAVQPFKKGPDYIDPMWLGHASGRPCYNLDFHTSSAEDLQHFFSEKSAAASVSMVEGNKGLYDGLDLSGSNSNAALANLLQLPVILVIDARGMTRGIAPLILGYQQFDPDLNIAGVILNQLGGTRHETKLRAVIEHYTDVPVLGALHRQPDLEIDERHLGLIPSNEHGAAAGHIQKLGIAIENAVDITAFLDLTRSPDSCDDPAPVTSPPANKRCRIGIARDEAFGFYYADDLEAMESEGAELVPFSPLNDDQLPDVDGLFIGGGFPETHAAALESNTRMRESVRQAITSGTPTYAECGGLMYLARSLQVGESHYEMADVVPANVFMHRRPQGRGYVRFRPLQNHPWIDPTEARDITEIPAHEFHYSSLEDLPPSPHFAYQVQRGYGITGKYDGLVLYNMVASYTHLRNSEQFRWTSRFIEFVCEYMGQRKSG